MRRHFRHEGGVKLQLAIDMYCCFPDLAPGRGNNVSSHHRKGLFIGNLDTVYKMLTKESGLLGLTEVTSDCRYVEDNYQEKADAKRAMDVYCHRLAKYIGSYTALMDGRLDAVIFTGGIGENAAMVRELSLGKLGVLGFEVDHERNLAARFGKSGFINKEGTRPAVVIPTNEELVIAQDASRLTA